MRAVALRSDGADCREQLHYRLSGQVACHKNEARAVVGVGPVFKLDWRMSEMLHRVDDDRPAALGDRKNALDAQQLGSAQSGQYGHRLFEHRPRNGLVEKQREAIETVGVRMVAEIEFAVRRYWLV